MSQENLETLQRAQEAWNAEDLDEIEDVRDAGDVTVTRVRFRGHGIEIDATWEQTHWQVAEWRQGKVIRLRAFLSEPDALEAAGLSE